MRMLYNYYVCNSASELMYLKKICVNAVTGACVFDMTDVIPSFNVHGTMHC